jgi:transcriptional regulator with XRE-family HTH domain
MIAKLTSGGKRTNVSVARMSDKARELIGRRVREERTRAGHTNQAAFAESIGIDPTVLSRIETGKRGVSSVLLQTIADRLEVPMDVLVRERQEQLVLARQGDADDAALREMVGWADALLTDMETIARFVGRKPLVS